MCNANQFLALWLVPSWGFDIYDKRTFFNDYNLLGRDGIHMSRRGQGIRQQAGHLGQLGFELKDLGALPPSHQGISQDPQSSGKCSFVASQDESRPATSGVCMAVVYPLGPLLRRLPAPLPQNCLQTKHTAWGTNGKNWGPVCGHRAMVPLPLQRCGGIVGMTGMLVWMATH